MKRAKEEEESFRDDDDDDDGRGEIQTLLIFTHFTLKNNNIRKKNTTHNTQT